MTAPTVPSPLPPVDELRGTVRGTVLGPTDPGYDDARETYYGGLGHRRPAVVVRPADAADVAAVVTFAGRTGAELAVRSGGHGLAGHATTDGGVLLDLSSLDALDLDVEGRTAWVGAGCTTGAYTAAAGEHGLATGFGDAPSVGIGGITLGGGVGFLSRLHGLTIDQLLAAEVVTADGVVRTVDADTEPELFWGLRGGGGNLGVVTRLRFRLVDVSQVTGGMLILPATPEVLAGFVAAADAAPDEVCGMANVMVAPPMPFLPPEVHGQRIVMALLVHAGPRSAADEALAPFRALATPLVDQLAPIDYRAMFEDGPPAGAHPVVASWNGFRDTFGVAEAEAALTALDEATSAMAVVQVRVLGGAIARVPADATAYAHRQRRVMLNVAAMYDPSEDGTPHAAWVERLAAQLREDGIEGAYGNFVGQDGRGHEIYPGSTWDRLAALKRRYDPGNLFRRNHNVPPA